jgi:uncharacterized protein
MILPVTSVTAGLLAFIFLFLSLRVILLRRNGGPSVGMGGDERFVRAVRAHANFAEYTPIFLILLGLNEIQFNNVVVHTAVAGVFVVGRILHLIGFGFLGTGPWRVLGMVATNTALIVLALHLLIFTLQ